MLVEIFDKKYFCVYLSLFFQTCVYVLQLCFCAQLTLFSSPRVHNFIDLQLLCDKDCKELNSSN